jgi:hypothetical protein
VASPRPGRRASATRVRSASATDPSRRAKRTAAQTSERMKPKKGQDDAKTFKAVTGKKAPAATDSHAAIADWIRRVMPDLHPVVEGLDELIRDTIPGLQYAVKWKKAHYGLPGHGWIIEMVAYDVSVNVVFFGGADFDPPPSLGTVGRSRYVKLKTLEDARQPLIRRWIEQAGRVRGWK